MKQLFSGLLISFLSLFFSNGFTKAENIFYEDQLFASTPQEPVTVYYKITGLNTQDDALLIDELLMKTGLVVSSQTNIDNGICKVELKDLKDIDKINEHIRTAWTQLGHELFVETIDATEDK